MKLPLAVAALFACAMISAEASPANRGPACIARVLHSEELPFAPLQRWLLRVTLQVTPPNGGAYEIELHDYKPWQAPPPRRGQTFRTRCDPANPTALHLITRPLRETDFDPHRKTPSSSFRSVAATAMRSPLRRPRPSPEKAMVWL
jgi:hypothetical protein